MKRKEPLPNYVRKLHELHRIGAIPREVGLHLVTIYHDAWCAIYAAPPQPCDCNPDIRVKATVPGHMN